MQDLNALSLPDLFRELTQGEAFANLLDASLAEDLGDSGDVTTASIITPALMGKAHVVVRKSGTVAGIELITHLLHRTRNPPKFAPLKADGDACQAGDSLGTFAGRLDRMLLIERTMLNFLGRLSGIATLTKSYVEAIADTKAVICDTRKTAPGLRNLEKYAVRSGGGTLHRLGLYDAALYKDNHLSHLPLSKWKESLMRAIDKARAAHDLKFVQVEVDTIEQFQKVLSLSNGFVDMILLDNMPSETLREAVSLRNSMRPSILLEASGGVTLETVRKIAETGVDRISVGALTHTAPFLDVGLDLR